MPGFLGTKRYGELPRALDLPHLRRFVKPAQHRSRHRVSTASDPLEKQQNRHPRAKICTCE